MGMIFSEGHSLKDMAVSIFQHNLDSNLLSKNPLKMIILFIKIIKHINKSHERTVYLYKPLPQNWLIGLYGYFIH